jgi:hypothetical protein
MVLYLALVGLVIFCLVGFWLVVFKYLLEIAFIVSMNIFGFIIGRTLSGRFTKATLDELHREDDVLLQATAFSQSVLVILLSQLSSEKLRGFVLYFIVLVAVTFYGLRAWAKIKDSQKYRYYSTVMFAFVAANSVLSFLKLSLNLPDEYIVDLSYVYLGIALAFAIIVEHIARKRYGHKGMLFIMG